MKNYILPIATVFCLFLFVSSSFAQDSTTVALLDKAVTLSEKGANDSTAAVLTTATTALETEAKSSGGSLKDKLLSKVGDLKSMIPLASAGTLQKGLLGKAVNAIKMLMGANKISSLLGKGESGLLGNAASLTSSLGLIKAGSSVLGKEPSSQLSGLLGEATKAVGGLNSKGITGKLAAKASSQSLGSIVKLVGSAL